MNNYIDELIECFTVFESVTDARFALLFDNHLRRNILFLAVGFDGNKNTDEAEIKTVTGALKQIHYPKLEMGFVSSVTDKELYNYIVSKNFPLHIKDKDTLLEQKIMKQCFDPVYRQEFLDTITNSKVIFLARDLDRKSNVLNVQTYVSEGKEYVPLFSDKEMVQKCGMTAIPENITPVLLDWKQINQILGGALNNNLYRLNPGNSFEVEFRIEE